MQFILVILVAIFTLGVLVLIHELGHFLVARYFKIHVLEFGFGLPPRIIGRKIGDTIYSLNWLPVGGFVHLLGEDEVSPEILKDKHSFASRNVWIRSAVVIAGVAMNLFLAMILYTIVLASQNFSVELPLLYEHQFLGASQTTQSTVVVADVSPDSPAAVAGLQSNDQIISINNRPLNSADELIQLAKSQAGQPITITVVRPPTRQQYTVSLTPRVSPPANQGPLGVGLSGYTTVLLNYDSLAGKIFSGPIHSYNIASYSIDVLSRLVSTSIAQRSATPVSQGVSGPVGIFQIVGLIIQTGDSRVYLDFMAALSLNLGIVNLLPFPGLDGGRLAFFVFEIITRKRPNPTVEKYIHSVGLVMLLALIVLITASDLHKIF